MYLKLRKTKIYQASTSSIVDSGNTNRKNSFLSEIIMAKLCAYWITRNYRESYGILHQMEFYSIMSLQLGETFVTRKITRAISHAIGEQDELTLGNLDAKRDWGHARDYVKMMWMILQAEEPDDWVIATGKTTSVRDFLIKSFNHVGIELKFSGNGVDEIAIVESCSNPEYNLEIGKKVVSINPRYFRPTEVDILIGDASKAKEELGWVPKLQLGDLIEDMMISDLIDAKKEKYLKHFGN